MIVAGYFWATRTPLCRTAETDFSRGIAVVETEEGLVNAGGSFSATPDLSPLEKSGGYVPVTCRSSKGSDEL